MSTLRSYQLAHAEPRVGTENISLRRWGQRRGDGRSCATRFGHRANALRFDERQGLAVRLSVNIPNFGDLPDRIGLGRMAREAEAAGADGVWLADHLLLVDDVMTGYPYTDDGVFPAPSTFPFYESLASCAYLAAATERC